MNSDFPPSAQARVAAEPAAAEHRPTEASGGAADPVRAAALRQAGTLVLALLAAAGVAAGLVSWLAPAPDVAALWAAVAAAVGALLGCGVGVWGLQRHVNRARVADGAKTLQGSAVERPTAGISRPMFMELSAREWSRARRYGSGAALLLIEVDRHESLRQTHGSSAVDAVMTEMLRLTAPTLRGADVLTRFGPVQMAIFLAHADPTGTLDVAERVRERTERLEVLFQTHGLSAKALTEAPTLPLPLSLTVSVGVAHLRPAHLQLQALIDDADDALAMARLAGGNCVRAAPVGAEPRSTPDAWHGDRRTQPK
ncbi:MAG: GGDEF domain-containing protein [Pseudomonadota bacterium]|nr:GGDEF domain-containing protein [Pseudomonadota bacterium]